MTIKITALGILVAFLLNGCTSSQPAPTLYNLRATPVAGQTNPHKSARIMSVAEPEMPAGFDTHKIVLYLDNGRRMDYYANLAWAARLSKVLQEFIIQSAATAPGITAVMPDSGFTASCALLVTLNDFEPVYAAGPESPPRLKVSMNFRLISLAGGNLVLDKMLSREAVARSNTQKDIISGLEALLREVNGAALKHISRACR